MHDVRDRRFVSLFFARLDPARKSVIYAAPGQNGHLLRTDGTIRTLDATGPLLGVVNDPQPASPEIPLEPGEIILLFTDGIAEATSPHGEPFGNPRIFETVRRHIGQPAADIIAEIEKAVLAFRGHAPLEDDVTMLMIKRAA
jgi:sigma-B regulation protein RsbU (phosphoserine phosphatase)